jgi:ribulose-bisphosphate carboxylase small chain
MTTGVHITQGTFSYLPELDDDEIRAQIQYGIDNGWAVAIEYTDDPHPRNIYWDMWGMPMFDIEDAAAGLHEVNRCREAFSNHYIKVSLYNRKLTKQSIALQFLVLRCRPAPRRALFERWPGRKQVAAPRLVREFPLETPRSLTGAGKWMNASPSSKIPCKRFRTMQS